MNILSSTCGEKYRNEAYLILRVVTGLAFFFHGFGKVFVMGHANVVAFFTNVGIPFASLAAYLVAYGELLGGIALMLGYMTHLVAKMNIVIILGAIFFVHWGATGGWLYGYGADGGYEYQLLLLAASIFFAAFGSGQYSVDAKCVKKTM